MKNTIQNLYMIFCTAVIITAILLVVGVCMGFMPKVLTSESMEPEVIRDSLVFVNTRVPMQHIEVGDNVAFKYDGVEILHKVINITADGSLVVKGLKDYGEIVVDNSMFIGRQALVFPRIGRPFLWLEKNGKWVGFGMVAMFFLLGAVSGREKKEKSNGEATD